MAWESTPWFIGGGADHAPEVARLLAHASTGGAEGIVTPGDLKVRPLDVPGTKVRVAPGACLIANRYPGGARQTYAGLNPAQHEVAVAATGSSAGRTDLVVARVLDPQYEGDPPADPNAFDYIRTEIIEGVPANTQTARELNLGYPAIELARIALPASTGTVTAAMITDLRRLANPRSLRRLYTIYGTGNRNVSGHGIPTSGYSSWPIRPDQRPTVWVPEWATHLNIVGHYSGVYFHRGADQEDTIAGIRTGFGSGTGENGILVEGIEEEAGRKHYVVVGDHEVSPDRRGSLQLVNVQAVRSSGRGSWWADYQTSIALDIEFTERAV